MHSFVSFGARICTCPYTKECDFVFLAVKLSSIMCVGLQCKIKRCGPLFENLKRNAVKGTKLYSLLSWSLFLLVCHSVFYLLFDSSLDK